MQQPALLDAFNEYFVSSVLLILAAAALAVEQRSNAVASPAEEA